MDVRLLQILTSWANSGQESRVYVGVEEGRLLYDLAVASGYGPASLSLGSRCEGLYPFSFEGVTVYSWNAVGAKNFKDRGYHGMERSILASSEHRYLDLTYRCLEHEDCLDCEALGVACQGASGSIARWMSAHPGMTLQSEHSGLILRLRGAVTFGYLLP